MQSSRRIDTDSPVGILLFESVGSRIVGDPGAEGTFDFPVRYGVVPGSFQDLIEGSPQACERLCQAARALEAEGVSAIAGDCGLMVLYQEELSQSVDVPVASSSLVLLPLLRAMLGPDRQIGVMTGHSKLLGKHHLAAAGAGEDQGIVLAGMESQSHFRQAVLERSCAQEYPKMARDVLQAAEELLERSDSLGTILLECSNLTPFAHEITRRHGVPVFDINVAIRMLRVAGSPVNFGRTAGVRPEKVS